GPSPSDEIGDPLRACTTVEPLERVPVRVDLATDRRAIRTLDRRPEPLDDRTQSTERCRRFERLDRSGGIAGDAAPDRGEANSRGHHGRCDSRTAFGE